jgi:hypothetical protein
VPLPNPEPGLVIRYDYLWSDESAAGSSTGKDRPACLVATSDPGPRPRFVVILPITHKPPSGASVGIEIPRKVKQVLKLDAARSWVIVSEYNVDEWPNGGLSALPGSPRNFSYGVVPPGLFALIKQKFLELSARGTSRVVKR